MVTFEGLVVTLVGSVDGSAGDRLNVKFEEIDLLRTQIRVQVLPWVLLRLRILVY